MDGAIGKVDGGVRQADGDVRRADSGVAQSGSSVAQFNIHQAKSQLSKLVMRAEAGEEIIIARAGHPVVKLVALPVEVRERPLGRYAGKIEMADDFTAPLSDEWLDSIYS